MTVAACPLCGAENAPVVFRAPNVPVVCNQLWSDAAAAREALSGELELAACSHCGLIWNRAFEPERMKYAPGYENALHFSGTFRTYADELAASLVARRKLAGRHLVEIGCGDGHMLDLMVRHGAATATGFDPSMAGKATSFADRAGVEIIPEHFGSQHLDRPFDAVLCRHVLEHLEAPVAFLRDVRQAAGETPVALYLEVPNAGWMVESASIWDVIYEHVTYWTTTSMETLLRRTGFPPDRLALDYGRQFLQAEATAGEPQPEYLPERDIGTAAALAFGKSAAAEISRWRSRLDGLSGPAVIWGAGSKGITFANAMGEAAKAVAAFVDLNPRKQGLNVPGVALQVVGPEALRDLCPELVIVANGLYYEEICGHARSLGLDPDFEVIAG